jgi:membrane-associated phospholipid phosphatase
MLPRLLFLPLPLSLFLSPLLAEEHSARRFVPNLLENQKDIWTFPFKQGNWESSVPWIMVWVAAASFSLDHSPTARLRETEKLTLFNGVAASRASDYTLAVFPAALLAAGGLTRNEEILQWGWKSSEAAFTSLCLSMALKTATQRPRPHTGESRSFWQSGNSFPSGHSLMAWSVAAATNNHFKEHRWVKWVVFPAAGLIASSRVSSGHHYASDVVVGTALGFAVGHYLVR